MGESGKELRTALSSKAPLPPLRRSPFPVGEGQEFRKWFRYSLALMPSSFLKVLVKWAASV